MGESDPPDKGYVMLEGNFDWLIPLKEDIPAVVCSFAGFLSFLVYGASCGALGPSLPYLADQMDVSTSTMGAAFTSRGVGYTVGTLGSAYLMTFSDQYISKDVVNCIGLCISGICVGIIGNSSNYITALIFFCIQGMGFGVMDTYANCCFPEIWGKRVRPWMQALHTCFGVGAIVGPAVVGACGLVIAFNAFFVLSFLPLVGLVTFKTYAVIENKLDQRNKGTVSKEKTKGKQSDANDVESVEKTIEISNIDCNPMHTEDDQSNDNSTEASSSASPAIPEQPIPTPTPSNTSIQHATESKEGESTVNEVETRDRPPANLRYTIIAFLFVYVGLIVGFSGWISYYALESDVTSSYARAAYLTSIFYIALTVGRFFCIGISIHCTSSFILRMELTIMVLAAILGMIILSMNYAATATVTALMALSLCAIYPIMLTIVDDFDYRVHSNDIKWFVIGGTLGEAIIPIFFGVAIDGAGADAFPVLTLFLTFLMCFLYFAMHYFSVKMIQAASLKDESIASLTVSLI